eukprot:jgi/Botrbrau1/15486/Bobra.43_2s0106.1
MGDVVLPEHCPADRVDSGQLASFFTDEIQQSPSGFLLEENLTIEDVHRLRSGSEHNVVNGTATAFVQLGTASWKSKGVPSHELDILSVEDSLQDAWLVPSPSGTDQTSSEARNLTDLSPLKKGLISTRVPHYEATSKSKKIGMDGRHESTDSRKTASQSQEATSRLRASFNSVQQLSPDLRKSGIPKAGHQAAATKLEKAHQMAEPTSRRRSQTGSDKGHATKGHPASHKAGAAAGGDSPTGARPTEHPRQANTSPSTKHDISKAGLHVKAIKPSLDVRASCQVGSRIPKPSAERASVQGPLIIPRSPAAPHPAGKAAKHPLSGASAPPQRGCSPYSSEAASSPTRSPSNLQSPTPAKEDSKLPKFATLQKTPQPKDQPVGEVAVAGPKGPPPAGGLSALEAFPTPEECPGVAKSLQGSMHDPTPKSSPLNITPPRMPAGIGMHREPWNPSAKTVLPSRSPPLGNTSPGSPTPARHNSPVKRDTRTAAQRAAANERALLGNLACKSRSDDRELNIKLRARSALPGSTTSADASMPPTTSEAPPSVSPFAKVPDNALLVRADGDRATAVAISVEGLGAVNFAQLGPGELPQELLGIRERKPTAEPEPPLSLSMVQRSLPRVRTREMPVKDKASCTSCSIM